MHTFGRILRELRCAQDLSMDKMIKLYNTRYNAKMNKSTLSRYENGLQAPMGKTIKNIADFFNVPTDQLYSGHTEGNTQTIGERIKNKRIERKLTQSDVANAVGVATSTIARYEKGQIESVKMPVVESISRYLGVDMAWVLGKSNTQIDKKDFSKTISLTHQEEELIIKYRSNPQMQEAVNKLLGI